MKRWNYLAALLVLLLLTLASGCAADAPAASAPLPPAPAEEKSPPADVGMLSAAKTETQAPPITDEEILAAYDRAVEAYSWFDLASLPAAGAAAMVDGWEYYPVEAPGIVDLNDLRCHLHSLFSEEITEELLASGGEHPLYLDIDGALYTTAGARGADIHKGTITTQVDRTVAGRYCVNVTVEMLAEDLATVTGLECWSFPYELMGDRWVFTDFSLVY